MAEMKTLNGHEIVDAAARKRLDNMEQNGKANTVIVSVDPNTGMTTHTATEIFDLVNSGSLVYFDMMLDIEGGINFRLPYSDSEKLKNYAQFIGHSNVFGMDFLFTVNVDDSNGFTVEQNGDPIYVQIDTDAMTASRTSGELYQYMFIMQALGISAPIFAVYHGVSLPLSHIEQDGTYMVFSSLQGDSEERDHITHVTIDTDGKVTMDLKEPMLGRDEVVLHSEDQDLTDEAKATARENIGAVGKSDLTLGVHTDGLLYIFCNGEPIGSGIALMSGDVYGVVDTHNNIIVTGNLPEGTYTVKYEMEDGSTIDIGNLVLGDATLPEPVTVNLTLTDGIRIGSDGADREVEGCCATPMIDLTNIPKPCIINLKNAVWCNTDSKTSSYARVYASNASGEVLVADTTSEDIGGNYLTVVANNGSAFDVTVTVTSDEVSNIRFSAYWSDGTYELDQVEATMTYTPVA